MRLSHCGLVAFSVPFAFEFVHFVIWALERGGGVSAKGTTPSVAAPPSMVACGGLAGEAPSFTVSFFSFFFSVFFFLLVFCPVVVELAGPGRRAAVAWPRRRPLPRATMSRGPPGARLSRAAAGWGVKVLLAVG